MGVRSSNLSLGLPGGSKVAQGLYSTAAHLKRLLGIITDMEQQGQNTLPGPCVQFTHLSAISKRGQGNSCCCTNLSRLVVKQCHQTIHGAFALILPEPGNGSCTYVGTAIAQASP